MKAQKLLFYLLAALLAGCVPSLHPFYTQKDLIYQEELIGKWSSDDPDWQWQFEQIKTKDPNSKNYYNLSITDEGGTASFDTHLLKLDDSTFLDLYPKDPNIQSDIMKCHLIPAHTLVKVEKIGTELTIRFMNPDKTKKILEKEPSLIKHEIIEDAVVLTASTEQLQKFVKEHVNDEGFFGDKGSFKKVMPKDPNAADPNDKKEKQEN